MNTEKPKRKGHPSPNNGRGKGILWIKANVDFAGDECLIWPLSCDSKGYARVGINGKPVSATRFMCELVNGAPPTPKHQAGHTCGKGHLGCCHPKHLKWITNSENQLAKRQHGTHRNNSAGPRGILTQSQRHEIVLLKGIVPIVELAKRYGVKRGTIDRLHRIAR